MWFKMKRNKTKRIKSYKIIWHRLIPFVIAEIHNHEWEDILKLEKEKKASFPALHKMYNKDGNWYIIEGLDYFWFNWKIFTKTYSEFLFDDSLHLQYNGMPDEERYKNLIKRTKEDIDSKWDKFYAKFKKKEITKIK